MSADIIDFTGQTRHPIDPEDMLRNIADEEGGELERVLVLAMDQDGEIRFFMSDPSHDVMLADLERARFALFMDWLNG